LTASFAAFIRLQAE